MSDSIITVHDLVFGANAGFRIPRFELKKGERVLLMGPSGCGKTSFLECLAGFRSSSSKCAEIRTSTSVVFQDLNLVEDFSVRENLALELNPEEIEKAFQWLSKLEFGASPKSVIKRLSKGEQQRVTTVRALAKGRELLLADEPTSHLDRKRADQLMELIVETAASALVVSHDSHLQKFFHRTVLFEDLVS